MVKYAIIGVEGSHDQAFVGKVFQILGFESFKGDAANLDSFWRKFIPTYPKKGNLYKRLDMPSIVFTDTISVAIYAGEGSNLLKNLDDIICNNSEYQTNLFAFGIIADADKKQPQKIAEMYAKTFRNYFSNFPQQAGLVDINIPRTGIYLLPDNISNGVLDTLLYQCGEIAYPEYVERARLYLDRFSEEERKFLKWEPFAYEKALVATVVSVLKPGKTNTVSIIDNNWISERTQQQVSLLANFMLFCQKILDIN